MTWHKLKDELGWNDVGGRLLANIAKGIYDHQAVLREYVQNACDAYNLLDPPPADPVITITPEGKNLTVQDFGVGMDEDEIRAVKKIAVSTKAELDGMAGFRGIGIWAGFQACSRLVMVTTKKGVKKRFRLVIEFQEILAHVDDNINIKQLVDPRYHIEWEPAGEDEHYTQVTLEDVHLDYASLLDPDELLRTVSQTLPCRVDPSFQHAAALQSMLADSSDYQEFAIKVTTATGAKEAFRQFPADAMDPPELYVMKDELGAELARVWFCRSQKMALRDDTGSRGFRMRIRNFAVGPLNIYSDEDGSAYGVSAATRELRTANRLAWFCGEIHVTNDQIVPNTPRDALEVDALARRLIEEVRKFYKLRIGDAGAHSDFNGIKKAIEEAKVFVATASGTTCPPNSAQEDRRAALLAKLQDAAEKTKGKSDSGAKGILRNLLNRAAVKADRRQLITQLTALAAPTAAPGRSAAKSGNGKGNNGKPQQAQKANGNSAAATGTAAAVVGATLDFEDLMAEIVEILERHLGEDNDDVATIAEDIKTTLKKRGLHNAGQPIP